MADMKRVRALGAFTVSTDSGHFHGDPNNSEAEVRFPLVPVVKLPELDEQGVIDDDLSGYEAAEPAVEAEPDVESGEGGDDDAPAGDIAVEAKATGGGYYDILVNGEKVDRIRGKAKAEAKVAELRAGSDEDDGADDDAPAE